MHLLDVAAFLCLAVALPSAHGYLDGAWRPVVRWSSARVAASPVCRAPLQTATRRQHPLPVYGQQVMSPLAPSVARPNATAIYEEANRMLQTHRNREAVRLLRQLTRLTPTNGKVWMKLVNVFRRTSRVAEAEATLRRGIKACPSNALLRQALADVCRGRKHYIEVGCPTQLPGLLRLRGAMPAMMSESARVRRAHPPVLPHAGSQTLPGCQRARPEPRVGLRLVGQDGGGPRSQRGGRVAVRARPGVETDGTAVPCARRAAR